MTGVLYFPMHRTHREVRMPLFGAQVMTHDEFNRRRHLKILGKEDPLGAFIAEAFVDAMKYFGAFFPSPTEGGKTFFATGGVMEPSKEPTCLAILPYGEAIRPRGSFTSTTPQFEVGDQLEHVTYNWSCVVIGYGWPVAGEYLVEATMHDGRVISIPLAPGFLRRPKDKEQPPG